MNAAETAALAAIKALASANRIGFTKHGRERMNERGARFVDVRAALVSAQGCKDQGGTWLVEGGVDTDGDALTVVCTVENQVVVVTLF